MEAKLQQTPEWNDLRKYRFTSSCIHKLVTDPKTKAAKEAGELSETAKSYILEKVVQEMNGYIPDFDTAATRWGNETEPDAKMWYHTKTGHRIADVQFCQVNDFYGGSPDSAVIDLSLCDKDDQDVINGALEIKCPYNSTNHLKHCLIDSPVYFRDKHPEYYWQCLSHMITLNVGFCDFVSFDPRIDHEIGLFIYRLYRDEEDAMFLIDRIERANHYKTSLKIKLGLL